jgi:exodeoxyribonuclease VII large subunit
LDFITLKQLNRNIRAAISEHTGQYWVVAEIASMNVNHKSGHCYLELVEKKDEKTVARMKATIWASKYVTLGPAFRFGTGSELSPGMKVLMYVTVSFHEVYGLSLNITDIDPSFTLGEMAMNRKRIIERLRKEGIIDRNKALAMPAVPQRIAVISSSTAAGFGDFLKRIDDNPYGYAFTLTLYEAYMQGERAGQSMMSALDKCRKNTKRHDIVVIIRGGGSQVDLQSFDNYELARKVALLPIPVITGIGHERDETVLDSVAHMRLITPTAAAEFIVSLAREFDNKIDELGSSLITSAADRLASGRDRLAVLTRSLHIDCDRHLTSNRHVLVSRAKDFEYATVRTVSDIQGKITSRATALSFYTERYMSIRHEDISRLETKVGLLDPDNILKRGYSVTTFNGKPLRNVTGIGKGDIISTRLHRGIITSTVSDTGEKNGGEEETDI